MVHLKMINMKCKICNNLLENIKDTPLDMMPSSGQMHFCKNANCGFYYVKLVNNKLSYEAIKSADKRYKNNLGWLIVSSYERNDETSERTKKFNEEIYNHKYGIFK